MSKERAFDSDATKAQADPAGPQGQGVDCDAKQPDNALVAELKLIQADLPANRFVSGLTRMSAADPALTGRMLERAIRDTIARLHAIIPKPVKKAPRSTSPSE